MSSTEKELDVPYRSIPEMFLKRVADTPDRRAFAGPNADDTGMVWLTWGEVADRAKAIAAGLVSLGVAPEDRVAILCTTRVDWILSDLGIMCAGAATTTIYPTTEPEDAAYILRDSNSKVLIAENAAQIDKIASAELPDLTAIVQIDGEPTGNAPDGVHLVGWEELRRRGTEALEGDPDLLDKVIEGIGPDHLATLIYTSGTTGRPKGVELLQSGWTWEAVAQAGLKVMVPEDVHYVWLPLSHSFGKTLLCGIIHVGLPTYVDGRIDKLVDNMAMVRPTLMCAVPRVYEKVYNRVVTMARDAGGLKWKIFSWAMRVGKAHSSAQRAGQRPGGGLAFKYKIADKLVFSKIRERFGGRIRVLVSGSAPLSVEIAEFFHAAGMTIYEGYGLTENCAGAVINRPGTVRFGTVGKPLGDMQVRIADDGEVLLRGTPIMRGYHHLVDETAAALSDDGWFHTGDIGEFDDDGYLRITDRKKDLIKTSGGKYVAPSYVEGQLKVLCPYISQALLIGQARNYCTMLVTLDPESLTAWAHHTSLSGKPYAELVASDEVRTMVGEYVEQLNSKLNRWETVKKFAILSRDITVEDGELTPSLKVKRRIVEEHFAADITKMYAGSVAEI